MQISNITIGFIIVLIFFTIFLGVLILLVNTKRKEKNNRNFILLTFTIAAWQIVNLLALTVNIENITLILSRLTYTIGALTLYLLVHFVLHFPQEVFLNKTNVKVVDYFCMVISIFISLLALNPNFVERIYFQNNVLSYDYGSLLPIFLIGILINLIVILISVIVNYLKSDEDSKNKIKYLFIGSIISVLVIIFTDVIAPTFFGTSLEKLSNFGFISSIAIIIFTAYAIIKHQLFEIKVILTETAVGIVLLAMLIQTVLSETATRGLINGVIFIIVAYGGYLIIKSVLNEIHQKEKLQELTMQLGQANSHLQELDKMKTEFVSLASHELLTPVSAIEGYLSMILDEKLSKVEDPKTQKYLDNVYKSAKRLARLVTDLLNISRIEEGRLLVEKQDVNLSDTVRQVVDELKFKAEEGKQKIEFVNSDGWNTFGDPDKIKEVIVNLVGNSIKYSKEPGTITISIAKVPTAQIKATWDKIEAEIKARPLDDQEAIKSAVDEHLRGLVGDEQLLVSVKDQGIGIPKEELPRLFKKFHRVGDFTTAESQGTGLGLYISRALVELNHGRIWADSGGQGQGSTFSFSLPLLEHKKAIQDLEALAPKTGEQLKPLARPNKAAEEI